MKIEQERLNAYLKKINGSPCPLCKNNRWQLNNTVFQTLEFDSKGLVLGGASYPIVPLTCMNCGNTYFINALIANLIDRPFEEKKESESEIAPVTEIRKGDLTD